MQKHGLFIFLVLFVSLTQAAEPIRRAMPVIVDPNVAGESQRIADLYRQQQILAEGTPQDEFLFDGGDTSRRTRVSHDWSVKGLNPEDTVAHYDTIDGKIVVEPSNRVAIYSPRFGSVRKVEGIIRSESRLQVSAANNAEFLHKNVNAEQIGHAQQEASSGYARAQTHLGDLGGSNITGSMSRKQQLSLSKGRQEPIGFSQRLWQSKISGADMPFLAEGSEFASAWLGATGLKVRINSYPAVTDVGRVKTSSVFSVKNELTDAALRIIKVAATETAQLGETVEFLIRFDNIGTQPIGNVTILDSLTGRLELIPESVQSSRQSGFAVETNEAGSLVLRFEITEPLEPLQYGIVKFSCRVR